MTLTLLIDLDDTLLTNSMDIFVPAYVGGLGKFLRDRIEPELLAQTLLSATQKMFENTIPDRTLKETFDRAFYPKLGVTESEMRAPIDQFYLHEFPKIKSITQSRPNAVNLINAAFQRGYTIGVATNPLFPLTAITQRLAWANLPVEDYSYSLISSYENFHFAKPNPAYYAEFLAKLGWPRGPVVMIGNDTVHDIQGAGSLGLATFWIRDQNPDVTEIDTARCSSGTLDDVIPWLDSIPKQILHPQLSTPSALTAMLRGISATVDSLLRELLPEVWLHRPQDDAWSLTEVICHLRDVEREINIPRLHQVLAEDNPFITGIDSDPWAKQRNYQQQNGPQALGDYLSARIETINIIDSFATKDWQRQVQHTILGPTQLQEIISIIAQHDRLHLRQIFSILR